MRVVLLLCSSDPLSKWRKWQRKQIQFACQMLEVDSRDREREEEKERGKAESLTTLNRLSIWQRLKLSFDVS